MLLTIQANISIFNRKIQTKPVLNQKIYLRVLVSEIAKFPLLMLTYWNPFVFFKYSLVNRHF